jgi:hypothetical protein
MPRTVTFKTCLLCASLGLASSLTGCALFAQPGPSSVSQSRYFQTGHPDYDPFFERLYQTQRQLMDGPVELQHLRTGLARRVKLTDAAEVTDIGEALATEAERLAHSGVYLSLVIDSFMDGDKRTAKHELTLVGTPPTRNDETFILEVGETATAVAELHVEAEVLAKGLPQLTQLRFELERKLASLPGESMRFPKDVVAQNLRDAEDTLPTLRKQAFQLVEQSEALIDALEHGFDTLRRKPADPPPVESANEPSKGPQKPAPKGPAPKPKTDAFQP